MKMRTIGCIYQIWDLNVKMGKLDYLAERKQPIGEELMTKLNVVLHQLKMGRG